LRRFITVDQTGKTITVSAYAESEARQKAEEALVLGNVIKFQEV